MATDLLPGLHGMVRQVIMTCNITPIPDKEGATARFGPNYNKLQVSDNAQHKSLKAYTDGNEVVSFEYVTGCSLARADVHVGS